MIERVLIRRFKSIRELSFECRRVNLFVGGPGVGKSNLLEALALWSWLRYAPLRRLGEFVRLARMQDLFYDTLLDEPIQIELHGMPMRKLGVVFNGGSFAFELDETPIGLVTFDALSSGVKPPEPYFSAPPVQYYRYQGLSSDGTPTSGWLLPPDGRNYFEVVFSRSELRQWVGYLFEPLGVRVVYRPDLRSIELQKQEGNVAISYPLRTASDTLLRTLFYYLAITSNEGAVLVFEEPEVHAFPEYVRFLGEQIASDANNQYFLTTHNPYLLESLAEKTPRAELGVFVVYSDGGTTCVHRLASDEFGQLLDGDPFFQLESLLTARGLPTCGCSRPLREGRHTGTETRSGGSGGLCR